MKSEELKQRTKTFGLKVIKLVEQLPRTQTGDVIGRQLLRSATSVGANYRAVCRARSQADFVAKIGVVEEEADESAYWLELLLEAKVIGDHEVSDLLKEADELTAIFAASEKTARQPRAGRSNRQS